MNKTIKTILRPTTVSYHEKLRALKILFDEKEIPEMQKGLYTAKEFFDNLLSVGKIKVKWSEGTLKRLEMSGYFKCSKPKQPAKSVTLKQINNPKIGMIVFHSYWGLYEVLDIVKVRNNLQWKVKRLSSGVIKHCPERRILFDASKVTEDTETIILKFKIK